MNNLLLDRKFQIDGHWYEPLHYLQSYQSVVKSEYWETVSSAGDWSGYIIQKIGNVYYLIVFSQENNGFYKRGFTLYTNSSYLCRYNYLPTTEEIYQDINNSQ